MPLNVLYQLWFYFDTTCMILVIFWIYFNMSNTEVVIRKESPCFPIFSGKSCSNLKSNDSFGFYSLRGFWSTPSKLNLMKYKLSYLRSNTNPPFKIKDILFNILINSLSKLTLEINNSFINLMMSRFEKFPWLLVKYA